MKKHPDQHEKEKVHRNQEATLVKQLEEQSMAFKGDFDKLDDEIKV